VTSSGDRLTAPPKARARVVVLDLDLDVVERHDENVCRPRLLIIRGDDDEPCFPGLERHAVVTLYQCEGLHLFEVEQRNERGLNPMAPC
jgi:hypothetical protein